MARFGGPARPSNGVWRAAGAVWVTLTAPLFSQAPPPGTPGRVLTYFSLEELMNLEVTSVAAKEQNLSRAAAAVYVITAEDIRRSGATNIPDLLRLVPGVNVAQIDANAWAVSVRGFNDRFANKVLVLVDGRSVYVPIYSGVAWDAVDVPLENIDRIEVIRGPGGTVWGANAVNGVINILTKSAQSTQGGLISAAAGSQIRAEDFIRYGGPLGGRGAFRVFGKYFNSHRFDGLGSGPSHDGWYLSHAGFRTDWKLAARDRVTVQGDFQRNVAGQTVSLVFSNGVPFEATINDRIGMSTGNVLGRWTHTLANGSEMSWQLYDDYFRRAEQGIEYSHNIIDAAFQHHIGVSSRHDLVWGLEMRNAGTTFRRGYSVAMEPPDKTDRLFSAFLQDEIQLADHLWLTAGTKVEHNDYTGLEFEPGAQMLWNPAPRQALWISAARAIRQPSSEDTGVRINVGLVPTSPIGVIEVMGDSSAAAEQLHDFEAGYRAQFSNRLSVDAAAFIGFYRDLLVPVPQNPYFNPIPTPHLVLPQRLDNAAHARSHGVELFLDSNITRRWRISPGYAYFRLDAQRNRGTPDPGSPAVASNSPQHQIQFRSLLNLTSRLEWDQTLIYVGGLKNGNIPAFTRVDSRVGMRIGESFELSMIGQNLLQRRHREFSDQLGLHATGIERSVFAKLTWRF